jgi:hypothetical protein
MKNSNNIPNYTDPILYEEGFFTSKEDEQRLLDKVEKMRIQLRKDYEKRGNKRVCQERQ